MKKYQFSILLIVIVLGMVVFYDLKKPDCANAQSCVTITPLIHYNTKTFSGSGCSSINSGNIFLPGTGEPYVAMTGWRVDYNVGNDHEYKELQVRLRNIVYDDNNVSFNIEGCLFGDNNWNWNLTAGYVVARWR